VDPDLENNRQEFIRSDKWKDLQTFSV